MRSGPVFPALQGAQNFEYNEEQQAIIQPGMEQFYICKVGADEEESFAHFQQQIENNPISFDGNMLRYASMGKNYEITCGGDFHINGKTIDTNYPRFDSPYIRAQREPEQMTFQFRGHSLRLNFNEMVRHIAKDAGSSETP